MPVPPSSARHDTSTYDGTAHGPRYLRRGLGDGFRRVRAHRRLVGRRWRRRRARTSELPSRGGRCSATSLGSRSGSGSRTGIASLPPVDHQAVAGTRRAARPRLGSVAAGTLEDAAHHPARAVDADEPDVGQAVRGAHPGAQLDAVLAVGLLGGDAVGEQRLRISSRTSSQMPSLRGAAKTPSCSALSPWTSTTCWIMPSGSAWTRTSTPATAGTVRLPRSSRCDAGGRLGDVVRAVAAGPPRRVAARSGSLVRACAQRRLASGEVDCAPPLAPLCRHFAVPPAPALAARRSLRPVHSSPACPPVEPCPPAPRRYRAARRRREVCPLHPLDHKLGDPVTTGDLGR